jgi:hypothetical protein
MSTETKSPPSMNGRLVISRRGMAKVYFSDDDKDFIEVDVLRVYDDWCVVDAELRDDKDEVPPAKYGEYGKNQHDFVQAVVNDEYAKVGKPIPTLTRAEAEQFVRLIREEAVKLRNFTSPKTETPSSPPENSATEERFSQ